MQTNKQNLLEALDKNIVTFTFTKLNKSSRIASGTRNMDLIPKQFHPKGTGKKESLDTIVFFDWEKQAWRSCRFSSVFGPWKITKEHEAVREIAEKAKLI